MILIHHCGSALNLNIRIRMLFLDGVYVIVEEDLVFFVMPGRRTSRCWNYSSTQFSQRFAVNYSATCEQACFDERNLAQNLRRSLVELSTAKNTSLSRGSSFEKTTDATR